MHLRHNWEYLTGIRTEYVITYYGTGMAPMEVYFSDKEEAETRFKEMCDDPYQGASSLTEKTILMRRVYNGND